MFKMKTELCKTGSGDGNVIALIGLYEKIQLKERQNGRSSNEGAMRPCVAVKNGHVGRLIGRFDGRPSMKNDVPLATTRGSSSGSAADVGERAAGDVDAAARRIGADGGAAASSSVRRRATESSERPSSGGWRQQWCKYHRPAVGKSMLATTTGRGPSKDDSRVVRRPAAKPV